MKRLVEDKAFLHEATLNSRVGASHRGWFDIALEITAVAALLVENVEVRNDLVERLEDGCIYCFSNAVSVRLSERSALSFRRGKGWHAAEDWGVWTTEGISELGFASGTSEKVLFLKVRCGPQPTDLICVVDKVRRLSVALGVAEAAILRVNLSADGGSEHTIRLVVSNYTDLRLVDDGEDRRTIGVGCEQMMVCSVQDHAARMNFSEAAAMTVQ